jgi:hypothetical protein
VARLRDGYKKWPYHQPVTDETLARIADVLWIPLTEEDDYITKQPLQRLSISGEELRAIKEGKAVCRINANEPMAPITAAVEKERAYREHSYQNLCDTSFLTNSGDEEMVRRFLALGGWATSTAITSRMVLALSRYLARLDRGLLVQKTFLAASCSLMLRQWLLSRTQ